MKDYRFNIYELEEKIDDEGGIASALDYGIDLNEYNVPNYLRDAWEYMLEAWEDFCKQREDVWALIEQARIDYDNNKEFDNE